MDLLDLFGRGYVIEHCVSVLLQEQDEKRYRAYVTDVLMLIAENTARAIQEGKYFTNRWVDGFKPVDTRTGDEIALDIVHRAGLTLKDGER